MKLVTAGIIVLTGIMIYRYLDIPLPPDMEEKWKIRIIDAILRTYGTVVSVIFTAYMFHTKHLRQFLFCCFA